MTDISKPTSWGRIRPCLDPLEVPSCLKLSEAWFEIHWHLTPGDLWKHRMMPLFPPVTEGVTGWESGPVGPFTPGSPGSPWSPFGPSAPITALSGGLAAESESSRMGKDMERRSDEVRSQPAFVLMLSMYINVIHCSPVWKKEWSRMIIPAARRS
jgi:hypothetical protein